MVTKREQRIKSEPEAKKSRVNIGKLELNRETVKDLTAADRKKVKGGAIRAGGAGQGFAVPHTQLEGCTNTCVTADLRCSR